MNFKQVILFIFTVLGLTGWIATTFELLPLTVTFCFQFFSAVLALLTIGYEAIKSLRERVFSMDMLATIAIVASIVSGEYFPATIVAFMLVGGEMLEDYAQQRSTRAIQKLVEEQPQIATVLREGQEVQIKPYEIKVGETIIVRPGAKIPADGVIQRGHAYVNQASVTGESVPIEKAEGASVYSGTIVQQGAIYVAATAVGEESTYGKIIALVKEAKEKKAPIERAADKYAKYFTPIILILGVIVFALTQDLMRMAAVFIIACPCALVLSTPAAIVTSIGNAARRGILIRNGETLEKMSKIDVLVMDKTGTITKGALEVIDIQSFSQQYSSEEILQFAAEAEKCSEHPFAKAIIDEALKKGLNITRLDGFEHHPGLGVSINNNETNIIVGNTRLMQKYAVQITPEAQKYIVTKQDQNTVVLIAKQQLLLGAISLSDQPRENMKNIVAQIKENGVKQIIMLTGDNKNVANTVATTCNIDKVIAELMPTDKVNKIKNFKNQNLTVAMVGDGINDAPALAQADIGIAMGLSGTEVAIETAGAVLVTDDLSKLSQLLKIGKTTMSIIKQNIVFAIAVNIIGIALSSQGLISPLAASIIHESNALIVMINSFRLLRVK
ncbi:MAG: cation-translocating P-type ATPase [Nitrososphaerota archaeon]|jgi:Cd2+/Zn2+-exporting ATPase|nr:cation-translocating P-type ATPase [Nitrososphaerota archaeon]